MKKTTVLVGVLLVLALGSLSLMASAQQAKNDNAAYTDLTPLPNPANAAPFVADRDESCRENATPGAIYAEETTGMEFVYVPGGEFQMGSPDGEGDSNEHPQHLVKVNGFWMGKYEVTQAQWQAVMKNNPSYFTGADRPVEQVSWNDAQTFLQKLNAATVETHGRASLRLPTEAEWEYAARARTQTAYSFSDDPDQLGQYAWYGQNSNSETHSVGQKKPNDFGLYDMHGNVWEWCQDWYADSYSSGAQKKNPQGPSSGQFKLLRGGAWNDYPNYCRSAFRSRNGPVRRSSSIGVRVVAVLARTE